MVEVGGFVEDFGRVGEDQEAVGEAGGDPEHGQVALLILGFEVEAFVLAEGRGVTAKIDGDVPDVSGEYADELSLRLLELVVKAAKDTARGFRLVVLDEAVGEAGGGERLFVEDFGKPTALIAEASGAAKKDLVQRCSRNAHPTILGQEGLSRTDRTCNGTSSGTT